MKRTLVGPLLTGLVLLPQVLVGQSVKGRFYAEKQTYLIGEPIFVVLDLQNQGTSPVFVSDSCAWLDTRFSAPTAPRPLPTVDLFGCGGGGWAGSCAGGTRKIPPGVHYHRRYLLDGDFRLDRQGRYLITAWHKIDFYQSDTSFRVVSSQVVVSKFNLTMIRGHKKQLEEAYRPLLRDLNSTDSLTSSLALAAIIQNPPGFLENLILRLTNNPNTVGASIQGLQELATRRAKAKLAELSGPKNPEGVRQAAVQALGELGDPAYCSRMLSTAKESRQYSGLIALRAAGYLCGAKVIPLARSFLRTSSPSARSEAAFALGNSPSRKAIPFLIALLRDTDPNVRRSASDALATLTHRTSTLGTRDRNAGQRTYDEWMTWWRSNVGKVKIYNIDHCGATTRNSAEQFSTFASPTRPRRAGGLRQAYSSFAPSQLRGDTPDSLA